MKVRDDLQKRKVDQAITGAKQIFNLFRNGITDSYCESVIDSLCAASAAVPGYKAGEITPLLMNAYYYRVVLNKESDPEKALDAAKKFSALGALTADNYFYKFYLKYRDEVNALLPDVEKAAKEKFKSRAKKYVAVLDQNMTAKPEVALEAGKKFLAMYDKPPRNNKQYTHVQDAILKINLMRIDKMQKSKQKRSVDTLFNTPAVRMYRSEVMRSAPVPRTPEPMKVAKSMNVRKPKPMTKSHHETSERKTSRKK